MALVAAAAFCVAPGKANAHAGHDHAPEVAAPVIADIAPRFYAQGGDVDVVLIFPEAGENSDATLFLANRNTNVPVAGAEVSVDVLSGEKTKIRVTDGNTSGAYVLNGLRRPGTTISLALEVMKDDLLEILSIDNVILTEAEIKAAETAPGGNATGATADGFPRYLVLALIIINAIVVAVALLAFVFWIRDRRRTKTAATASLLLVGLCIAYSPRIHAHAGDDHSGVTPGIIPEHDGEMHFMPIDAQFEADVQTTRVIQRKIPKSFRALGQVEIRADRKAVVTTPVDGKLIAGITTTTVPIAGLKVERGDVLVTVQQIIPATEKVTLSTERSQVEADLGQAQQQLAIATREKERAERLANIISVREVEQARADLRIAQDRVVGLRKRLETLTAALGGTGASVSEVTITAPISGTITSSHAVLGEYVRTDKTLFEIVNLEEVFVGADVFESDLALVRDARSARITLEAYPNLSFSGELHAIGQEVDPDTRSIHVQFAVGNPGELLRGGMFANIEIESGTEETAMIVPRSAVISQDGVRQVFKKIAPETFAAQIVNVSAFREDVVVIKEGLDVNDRVVISGLYQVRMSPTVPALQTAAK